MSGSENTVPSGRAAAARFAAGAFVSVPAFQQAIRDLIGAGIAVERISVLGRHDEVAHNFDGIVPDPDTLMDSPDTPREPYVLHEAVRNAIHVLAESVATIGMIVMAGASYAVGGPVGAAAVSADNAEIKVESLLDDFVDRADVSNFRRTLEDGGLICWVECATQPELEEALQILETSGGAHVHPVDTSGSPVD